MGLWERRKSVSTEIAERFQDKGRSARTKLNPNSTADESLSSCEAPSLVRAHEESGVGWFWATDATGGVTYITHHIVPLLTSTPNSAMGRQLIDLFVQGNDGEGGRTLAFMLTKQSKFDKLVVRSSAHEDGPLWSLAGVPQFRSDGSFIGFCGSGVDITEQLQSSEHASRLAMYDALTGLPNRLRLAAALKSELNAFSVHKRSCAVMMLDLDRFKQVNDTLGHPAGDNLLNQVADRLFRIVGDKERIFRVGGDEFQIIVRDCPDPDSLSELGNRIIAMLSQPYSVTGRRCIIGASVGIAVSQIDGTTSEELIRNADLALYDAKARGRGCVSFYSRDLLKEAEDKRVLEEDLRDALARGEISVFYQPFVNARTNVATGVEALVRWHHPERGLISPDLFIPIAEEANLIGPLGEWILRKACEDAASWPGKLRVSVNVSPIQFTSGSLPAIVTSALASSELSPERLELEITEGVFLSDSGATDTMFAALKELGVRLALDDFGTGYSSLGYLRTAPFDKIKIDKTFVRAATLPGSRNAAIIAAIVALAEALGMETTAEGIETEDQLELIRSLRVSHVQGYIYSPAITSDVLHSELEDSHWTIVPSGPKRQRSDRVSMFRKVRALFGNHHRQVLIRNLSETGALVEGLEDVPFGSQLIIDFGDGNLIFATLNRSRDRQQGLAFEEALVFDEDGGFRSPYHVSNYALETADLPKAADPLCPAVPAADNAEKLAALRSKLGIPEPRPNPSHLGATAGRTGEHVGSGNSSRDLHERPLSPEELRRLIGAAEESTNQQLKYIVMLLIRTRVRQRDLLEARWDHFDLDKGQWTIPSQEPGNERRVLLSAAAVELIRELPRWVECPFLLANPTTKMPYRSFTASWHTARVKADLPDVEIDDLRFCNLDQNVETTRSAYRARGIHKKLLKR